MSQAAPARTLIGRDADLRRLGKLVQSVAAGGSGSYVLIEGEPGIGKSALARAASDRALAANCQVFWGSCDELGQALPLVPFLDGLGVRVPSKNLRRTAITQMLRGEVTGDRGADVTTALAEQLQALVIDECAAWPTVLVIDDLQWADPGSVALWARLARAAQDMPLLLIGTMRPIPRRDDLLALRRAAGSTARIHLGALADEATAGLVAALTGGTPDSKLLRLADGAAGNPLYVTELIAALARSSSLTITGSGTVTLAGGSAPSSLSAAIADRIGFVTGPTLEVLKAAALLGVTFAVTDLATVLGRSVTDLFPAIEEACIAEVLAESDSSLGFRHPLIRDALYDEIPAPLRVAWHRDMGEALAEAGAPPDRVARQLLRAFGGSDEAAEPMDEWVLNWLTRTADTLIAQAPGVAAELLTGAVASRLADPARQGWLASRLADALYRIGDRRAAEKVSTQALDQHCKPDLLVDLHWTLAQCCMLAGSAAESLATLQRALTTPGLTARHRARLLVLTGRTHKYLGQLDKAVQVATRALAEATEAGDSAAMAWALHVLAIAATQRGELIEALPLFDRALTVTRSDPALTDLGLLLQINQAVALAGLDQYEPAFAVAAEARDLAGQVGSPHRQAQAHGAFSQLLFETGQWDDALIEAAIVPDDLKEPAAACWELGIAAVVSFHRGDIDTARRRLAAALTISERIGRRPIGTLALACSLNYERKGALPAALDALTGGFDGNTEALHGIEDLLADAARLATETGDLATARTLAEHTAAVAAGSAIPHRQANALYCQGLVDHDGPRLLRAAAWYEDAGRPLERAKALEAAAGEFVTAGEIRQARAAFTRAVEVYTGLGAAADIDRLQAVFRAHGIRRGPHVRHREARSGWASLTPTEMKIAAFVEDGLSNPEIAGRLLLSRRTVATHVSHILKKLDVHSRTDIARESALRTVALR